MSTPPPEADEFGLPVRPPRRRFYSLEDLDSPEQLRSLPLEHVNVDDASKEEDDKAKETDEEVEVEVPNETTMCCATSHNRSEKSVGEYERQPSKIEVKSLESSESPGSPKSPASSKSPPAKSGHAQKPSVGEFSHQQLAPREDKKEEEEEEEECWQTMPAYTAHRTYDDWGKVIAHGYDEMEDESVAYGKLGGAGKGYTRVQMDEDAQSATSMDDNTAYLFKNQYAGNTLDDADEEGRDPSSQMQTTKELLTEGQRIAYVGLVRLAINKMAQDLQEIPKGKGSKRTIELAAEGFKLWGQKIMIRLYTHMDISGQEQVMVEQLADHGVMPSDLTHTLMQNARVKNPQANLATSDASLATPSTRPSISSPRSSSTLEISSSRVQTPNLSGRETPPAHESADQPPAYQGHAAEDLTIQDPYELTEKNIDLDLRWTVLCDLFLLLIKDGQYDARSRTLLERVGSALLVEWQEICRFEKRVTDALEMQEEADRENWNEEEHMKAREKRARNRRLMVMGLCTVGGGLVIGLSAGMLAPVIGAGLAAGFTGIGITGTGTFLGGTGAAALIGTTGTLIGGSIGMKGSNRRTGAVSTFEYRPLYNNKRVNLIVTISGWMTGKVDDVRLPFSTVDPIMGDIYSVNWEPDMLQSTGQTIQILGTEALTQTIQQILGATFLATLMAGLSLPIVLTKLAYLIDNPWTVSLARADAAGLILADSLIDRNLGIRPITLVGFSLGSRVIFSCLKELARRGAIGLVQNVYMFGSPVVVKRDEWSNARSIVSGRFVNGYATNDWILAYLFRATSGGIMRVAGLATVDLPGIENINVTDHVPGHMAYRGMMPVLLKTVGWMVESEEFTEIEDPDPDNHERRQRELLNEIEQARAELEGKPEKKGWKSIFSRKKTVRKEWEMYDERSAQVLHGDDAAESERIAAENSNVMFDIDAIRKEALNLALEGGDMEEIKAHMRIKEIESTMPALKIETPGAITDQASRVVQTPLQLPSSVGVGLQRSRTHDIKSVVANGHLTDEYRESLDEPNITMTFESPERTNVSPLDGRPALKTVNTAPAHVRPSQSPDEAATKSWNNNPWVGSEDSSVVEKDVEMSFE
ncbi:hypothetical protein M433DRAFT_144041 [Acidomyces richmondensis BFW]|nr:hypothetical protein M433DRAFT_144041 [Acidomyces richmondensis BFW]